MSEPEHVCKYTRKDKFSEQLLKPPHYPHPKSLPAGAVRRLQYHTSAAWLCKCGNSINLTQVHFVRLKIHDWASNKIYQFLQKFKTYSDD